MISLNSHNFNKHPIPAVSNYNGNNRSPFDLLPSHDPTLTFRLTESVSRGASGFWLQTCLVPSHAQNSVQKMPAPVKLPEKYLQARPLHISWKIHSRNKKKKNSESLQETVRWHIFDSRVREFCSLGFAFAGFPLRLFVSCCCILVSCTPSCFHHTDCHLDCQWCFSSHSALFRLQAPAADANKQPREGAPASSRFPAPPGLDAVSEDGMQHFPALCTASSSSLSPAPSPSCCHTGCARQSLFSQMPGSEWGREGWWKGRGKGDGWVRGSSGLGIHLILANFP